MKSTLLLLSCLAALLSGCGPQLSHTGDYSLAVGEILTIPIDPINTPQTIKITASSPNAPINLHVFLKEHEELVEQKITYGKPSENLLASQTDAKQIALEVQVPADKEALVRFQAAGVTSAKVHLEIRN